MVEEGEESLFQRSTIAILARLWKIKEFFENVVRYYIRKPLFAFVDFLFLMPAFFKSPYRTVRKVEEKGVLVGPYGETPYSVLDAILEKFSVPKEWKFIDCGMGRGRLLLWLYMIRQQKELIGIELIHPFCSYATTVFTKFCSIEKIQVVESDIITYFRATKLEAPSKTVLYLYLSSLSDEACHSLGALLSSYEGLHIISVSYPFRDYGFLNIEVIDKAVQRFPWGETELYYQRVNSDHRTID